MDVNADAHGHRRLRVPVVPEPMAGCWGCFLTPRCHPIMPFPAPRQAAGSPTVTTFPKGFFPFLQPSSCSSHQKGLNPLPNCCRQAPAHPLLCHQMGSTAPKPCRVKPFAPQFPVTGTLHGAGQQDAAALRNTSEPQPPTLAPPLRVLPPPRHAHTLQWVRVSTPPAPPHRLWDPLPSPGRRIPLG